VGVRGGRKVRRRWGGFGRGARVGPRGGWRTVEGRG